MKKNTELATQIVEAVLSGKISDRAELSLRVSRLEPPLSSKVATAIHQAGHFVDDADIRLQDRAYDETQRRSLLQFLETLRNS